MNEHSTARLAVAMFIGGALFTVIALTNVVGLALWLAGAI